MRRYQAERLGSRRSQAAGARQPGGGAQAEAYERAIDAGSVRSSRVMVTLAASLALAEPR